MKFYLVDIYQVPKMYELPEDYKMDELFCLLTNINDHVSDEDVHTIMADSDLALVKRNGTPIRFCDHANGVTTLAQLGITSYTQYYLMSTSFFCCPYC